ncbi:MAG: leucyl aminopeptidase [Actinobacteria bacterium 69-20]|nr:leucyl aminopeptidase [Actinomycetota bacterium]OJV23129.1 MAG: leucyl aminopeptidase [Actinobacteria bacterium 69-20]
MPSITLTTSAPDRVRADALVIGVYAPEADGGEVMVDSHAAHLAPLARLATAAGARGRSTEMTMFAAPEDFATGKIIAVGLGKRSELTAERIRRAAGVASRAAAGCGRIVSTLGTLGLAAATEGHLLGAYRFTGYKAPVEPAVGSVALVTKRADRASRDAARHATVAAEAVALARDLVNTAPNDLPPAVFAERAADAGRAAGLTVQVFTERALERGGYGGILAVGSGSARPPRLVRLAYRPARPKASVALVGKGITFDSGGISIKPAAGMDHMTSDMAGAASVVAAVIAASALKLPIAVTATVPMAENLPSGSSYRPGDVLTHRGGQTVHVLNTDAEGRLILADAIVRAGEDKPDYLLTVATLTGAQIVALGNRTMGVMGTAELRDRVAELAREVGEGGWAMPLPEELREGLDSPLADIANVASDRAGGMLVAGHYLAHFVPDGLCWAHLDVAGPAFNTGKPYGYTPEGGTGVPVRTLLAVLTDLAGR